MIDECPICDRELGIDDGAHVGRCLDRRIAAAVAGRDAEWSNVIGFSGPSLDPELAKAHLTQIFQALRDEKAAAIAAEWEACCKAICGSCMGGHPVIAKGGFLWHTDKDGLGGEWPCNAARIRARQP